MPEKLISDKRKFIFPLAIFLIMAASAAIWLPKYGGGAVDVEYQQIAINMLEGKGFSLGDSGEKTMVREPFYPFSLFLNYKIFGVHNYLIYFEQFLLLLLICFFTYKLAVRFFGDAVAKIAALAVVIHPLFVIYAASMSSEIVAAFLISFSCFFFVRSLEGEKLRFSFLAGAGLGLLVLTKTIFLPIPFFAAIFYYFCLKNRRLAKIILFFAAFAAIVFPWMCRNYVYFDKVAVSERGGWVAYMHASKSELSVQQLRDYAVSSFLSQYFVRLKNPDFNFFDVNIKPANEKLSYFLRNGYSSNEADTLLAKEAERLWRAYPLKNFLVGFLEVIKANAPTVPKDSIVFVYSLPDGAASKIMRGAALILMRLFWFGIILAMLYGIFKAMRMKIYGVLSLVFIIFYVNAALFFLEGVPRNIFPIYSLYFIFFAFGFWQLWERFLAFELKDNHAQRPTIN